MSHQAYLREEDIELLTRQFPDISRDIIIDVAQQCELNLQKTTYFLFELTKGQSPVKRTPEWNDDELRILDIIKEGWKVIVLMRGLPGSGKTVLAHKIFNASNISYPAGQFILSTDDFFKRTGGYKYDLKKLDEAHDWNQKRCYKLMVKGFSPIIIDNTNLAAWEMKIYCAMAVEFGYAVEILEPATNWARNPNVLAQKNNHNVPREKIIRMMSNFEQMITPFSLLSKFGLRYNQGIPQKRLFPPLYTFRDQSFDRELGYEASSSAASDFDFSFEKQAQGEEKIMEYVHCFDKKKTDVTKDEDKNKTIKEENKNDNGDKIMEYVHNFDHKKNDVEKKNDDVQKESTKDGNKIVNEEPVQPTTSESKIIQSESKNTQSEPGNIQSEPKILQSDPKSDQSESKTTQIGTIATQKNLTTAQNIEKSVQNDPKSSQNDLKTSQNDSKISQNDSKISQNDPESSQNESKTTQNEPKTVQKESPKPNEEPKVYPNLIDLLDDTPSTSSNALSVYGAFPLMPINVQPQNKPIELTNPIINEPKSHLNAWGTNEAALQSWETVVPLQTTRSPIAMDFEIFKKLDEASNRSRTQLSDKTTNTHSDDFRYAQNCSEANGVSILKTQSRQINGNGVVITKCAPRKKITVDMGCMTEEINDTENRDEVEQQLIDFFPHIPIEHMLDVYEKCNKDLNWTMDLLLETEYVPNLPVKENSKKTTVENTKDNSLINTWESTPTTSKKPDQNDQNEKLLLEKLELKKKFEENFTFNKEHYSEHVWGLKTQRQPTLLKNSQNSESEEQEDEFDSPDEDGEDSVQVNLGYELVTQLERLLGSEDFINKNLPTTVQMPLSLVKQLHALYLQSVSQHIEEQNELVNKDEEFAQKLSDEEREAINGPNLSKIMDEQLAMFYQKQENEQYKTMTPETLAMVMKKNKLYEIFPTVNHKMIDQLLQTNNYNYEKVVDELIASVNQSYIVSTGNIRENPASDELIKDMRDNKAIVEQVTNDEDYHNAQQFRDDATSYAQKAQDLQNLAQQYHRKGMGQVAVFYSKLAEDMRGKRDYCNQKASYMYLYENSLKVNKDTLDLHFLSVPEALTSLDIYIDKCVAKLSKPKDFYVITGRGKRSAGGKSQLKPVVIARLRKRKITFSMVNPGMLRIKLHKNVTMTNDLKKN